MPKLFLSQQKIDEWLADGCATLEGEALELSSGQTFQLQSAIYFDALIDGEDSQRNLGVVRPLSELPELSIEHYADSAIYGETAYQVVEGFLGEEIAAATRPAEGEIEQVSIAFAADDR